MGCPDGLPTLAWRLFKNLWGNFHMRQLTVPGNLAIIVGFAVKKAKNSAQRKHCKWFVMWTTGPRLTGLWLAGSEDFAMRLSGASWD